jgi:hypothetical protein
LTRKDATNMMHRRVALGVGTALFALTVEAAAMSENPPDLDVHALFATAEAEGRVGIARKTKPVDARPARPGEVIITLIKDEGRETQSKPAAEGDWVVRNRCPATGNEQYLVKAGTFAERYVGPLSESDPQGWREFRPTGPQMRFFIVSEAEGAFRFTAPWGEAMRAQPGDAIVRNPAETEDTYRVAASAFECTYEIVTPAASQ